MPLKDRVDPNLLKNIDKLPISDQEEILSLIEELEESEKKAGARDSFMKFVKTAWPAFIEGRHHKIMGDAFDRVANGSLKRLIVNMPPRHTKSEFASYLLQRGFWASIQKRRLFRQRTPPSYLLALVERCVIWWIVRILRVYFLELH